MTVEGARMALFHSAMRRAGPAFARPGTSAMRDRYAAELRDAFATLGLELSRAPGQATDIDFAVLAGATYGLEKALTYLLEHRPFADADACLDMLAGVAAELLAALVTASGTVVHFGDRPDELEELGKVAQKAADLDALERLLEDGPR